METGKGLNNNEIEKEAKMGVNSEIKETAEKELNTKVGSLEKNIDTVKKTVEEIGDSEVVTQVLNKMSPEERQIFNEKIENVKNKMEKLREYLRSEFTDDKGHIFKYKIGKLIASPLSGFVAGSVSVSLFWLIAYLFLFR